jgi:hypothetical protein
VFSCFQPFSKPDMVFNDLLLPCLDREITLGKRDLFLAGIAILGDEVTGIPGQEEIPDYPFPAFWNRYRFVGVNKMI